MTRKDKAPSALGARSTKSKSKAKSNKRRPSGKPEFFVADWLPATEAVARLTRLLGSPKLARHQLCRDIRRKGSKRLPAATRCIRRDGSDAFERLTPAELESFDLEGLLEANAAEIGDQPNGGFGTIDDGEYGGPEEQSAHAASAAPMCWLFVDRARFEKMRPAATVNANDTMRPRVKPGPKVTGDWYTVLGAWLIEVACNNPKRLLNVDALALEANTFLEENLPKEYGGWTPPEKELRQKIVEFLQLIPR